MRLCVYVCVLEGRAEEGTTRRERRRDGTRVERERETLTRMGGQAGGQKGFEGSSVGRAEGQVGGVEIGRWGRGGRIGMSDGVALRWELGVKVGWGRG